MVFEQRGGFYLELTKNDINVLNKKLNNENEIVKCPHCGAEIIIVHYDSGCVVKCKKGCIKDTIRGL